MGAGRDGQEFAEALDKAEEDGMEDSHIKISNSPNYLIHLIKGQITK